MNEEWALSKWQRVKKLVDANPDDPKKWCKAYDEVFGIALWFWDERNER